MGEGETGGQEARNVNSSRSGKGQSQQQSPSRKRQRSRKRGGKSEKSVQSNKVDSSGLKATPPHSGPEASASDSRSNEGSYNDLDEAEPSSSSLIPMGGTRANRRNLMRTPPNSSKGSIPVESRHIKRRRRDRVRQAETELKSPNHHPDNEDPNEDILDEEEDNLSETSSSSSAILNAGGLLSQRVSDNDDFTDDDADDGELAASLASTSTPVASSSGRRVPLVFQTGDVVWGPHGNFPSWPGKLVSAPQSQPSADGEAAGGGVVEGEKAVVCWFGNRDITSVDSRDLKSLSEGLEAHHKERQKLRKG